ncbi:hypothetical protein KDA11_04565 [Candidatus Saccharibacteria bacterium]|nr:hypothetical protein [Candidatus Saccharibacteria bacterium]
MPSIFTDKWVEVYKNMFGFGAGGMPKLEDLPKVFRVKFGNKLGDHPQAGFKNIWHTIEVRDLTGLTGNTNAWLKVSKSTYWFLSKKATITKVKHVAKTDTATKQPKMNKHNKPIMDSSIMFANDASCYIIMMYMLTKACQYFWMQFINSGNAPACYNKYKQQLRYGGPITVQPDDELEPELQLIDYWKCDMNRVGETREPVIFVNFSYDEDTGISPTTIRQVVKDQVSKPVNVTADNFEAIFTESSACDIQWVAPRSSAGSVRICLKDTIMSIRIDTMAKEMTLERERDIYGDEVDEEVREAMAAVQAVSIPGPEPEHEPEPEPETEADIYGDGTPGALNDADI